jgi:hypothetical protein
MQIPQARVQQKVGNESVFEASSKNLSKQQSAPKIDSQLDPEIERSLYYLGKALYLFSLLQQERRAK